MDVTEKKQKITNYVVKNNAVHFRNVRGSMGNVFMSSMDDSFAGTDSIQNIAEERMLPRYRNKQTTYEKLSNDAIDDIYHRIRNSK
jgi:hypothetical protein